MNAYKRTQPRYAPGNNAFISLGYAFTCVGSINDISMSGAAFEYFSHAQSQPPGGDTVDIFICGTYMHIADMPCRVVYEQPVAGEHTDALPDGSMLRKRCGIEFKPATPRHREQLETFVQQYMQNRSREQE